MDDWYLKRLDHHNSKTHLNILLGKKEELIIGQKAGDIIDIECNGKFVSRKHCILKFIDNSWTIEDLKSKNGVYLNGNRIAANTPTILSERDVLGLGAIEATDPTNFVFVVLKNTVKDDNKGSSKKSGDLAVAEVGLPPVSAAHMTPVRNDDAKINLALSNTKPLRPSRADANLKLDCKAVVKLNHPKTKSKNIAANAKNSLSGLESKGKALKKGERSNAASVCKVPKSVLVTPVSAAQIDNLAEDPDDCADLKANIILSSGDEKTFPLQTRFKQELLNSPVRKLAEDQPLRLKRKFGIDSLPENVCKKSRSDSRANVVSVNEAITSVKSYDETIPCSIPGRKPPTQKCIPPKTPCRPVDKVALTNDFLLRVIRWSFAWIEEQKRHEKKDEPPPLLDAFQVTNCRSLPELSLLPVVSDYATLEDYCSIFTPLMLHEVWAGICKDVDINQFETLETLIYPKPTFCVGFALLHCEALSLNRISNMDLVSITVIASPQKPPVKMFAVAEQVRYWKREKDKIDPRLLETCQHPYIPITSFDLRVYRVPPELNKIFTVTKITPLKPVVKQLILNAELARSPLCDVILHPSDYVDAFKLETENLQANHTVLNACQFKAVESIAKTVVYSSDKEPKISLVHGPPGTGKSRVIVEMIVRMMSMYLQKNGSHPRILVCAPSNHAIDEIATRLINARDWGYRIVRIGVTTSMRPEVKNISLDDLTSKKQGDAPATRISPDSDKLRILSRELNRLQQRKENLVAAIRSAIELELLDEARMHGRKLKQLEVQIDEVERSRQECYENHVKYFHTEKERLATRRDLLVNAQIICSTINSCRSKEMENLFEESPNNRFLCCIIDEASQCTEPESLTPLAFGISKLVLIGDPDQLPATVLSPVAQKKRFHQSLFNRLHTTRLVVNQESEGVIILTTQYRMASSICEWPSRYFYGGKIVTAEGLIRNGPCYEYRVLNVIDGIEEFILAEQSFRNEQEAAVVAKIVKLIVNSPLTFGKSVGVITFYQSQKQCISQKLNEVGCSATRVDLNTVDSFQGRETDIVVISCVRAKQVKKLNSIGFIGSLQRMNVALTRAKESLIVCGHFETLQRNETWQDFINNARSRNVTHVVSSDSSSDDMFPMIMRPPYSPLQQQQMVASFSEKYGMNMPWSLKCLEETEWDLFRATFSFTKFKAENKIPPEAFIPIEQQQQMVAWFSFQSGMNMFWSLKCLKENEWDYDRAASNFVKVKDEIPPEAFIK